MFIHERERFTALINKLKVASKGAVLIVEGKKDKAALEKLGIESDFFLLQNANTSLEEASEQIAQKSNQVIMLLDADRKGLELTKKMKAKLQKQGSKVNTNLGNRLLRLLRQRTIESISSKPL